MSEQDSSPQKETFGFRAQKTLATDIREYAEKHEMSGSDALRSLIRQGFETEQMKKRVTELEDELSEAREYGEDRLGRLSDRIDELEEEQGESWVSQFF